MIEDLDAIEPAPLESQRTPTKLCSCEEVDVAGRAGRERGDLRKIRSEVRWATSSFLSPDDAIWDLRRRTSEGTEFRWELHTSSTDLDLAKKTRCSCHSLTPEEKKPEGVQRGDLRKHHSAETDKWSVRPDHLLTPMHDLRKHSSDDTRFAREARWLQVPDVMPNPKPRCTCPKVKTPAPASPEQKVMEEPEKSAPPPKEERRLYYSKSLAPEESATPWEKPEMKRQASEQPKPMRIEKPRERPKLERSAQVRSESSRKWGLKEKIVSPVGESKKPIRARWAMKPHVSLPAEKKAPKWYRSQDETKSKSLRERPKYSIRRSMSPEPDPRQVSKLENRIVRRLISPEITITSTKWAPYEDSSPLPTIGIKKREQKHISEIKWTPYDESPSDIPVIDDTKWSPFQNVTPTHCPPPDATPCKSDDEQFRWRMLNLVAPFPLYQGGWKDESPEKTPPKKIATPEDLSPPVWSPMVPATPTSKRRSIAPQPSMESPSERRPSKSRLTRKGAFRAKSMVPTTHPLEDRLPTAPPPVIVRAASEETKRQRPQLMRSKALLDVPVPIDATKRSLSEEGPRMRPRERPRAPGRARSEEVSKYGDPWFESPELREYVTTV
ncbi:PREDICTED: pollen-specific leucine-rich repeat extensin-like protein 1 [Dinoponera quadriceps]|uniref:Pollen-specific leucine-rich repeat extensin-like protein 1 n=1 Tax=Dinoponera quadriceps TaxID=609295 RepID=A0A6P3XBJ4_DINQU|nr:PREDICTED: pollen-specific leucine-rich repeat extensin-like protein 1 [Dinoponera quadriceps]